MVTIFQTTFWNGFSWMKMYHWISIYISLKFVLRGPINNIPALVQIMAWRWPGDKPLSKPMMVRLPTHICVTRPQWVKEDRGLFILHSLSNKLLMTWQLREPGHQLSWYWPSLQEYSGFSTISQIPQCIQQISHNAPYCTHLHISVIRTLHDCPSQVNENLLISNSKLMSDSELIWWR